MNPPIRLTHRQQSTAGRCLPACAGMILDRLNIHLDENHLAELLGTRSFGTPGFAIKLLETLGVEVNYGECNIPNLLAFLDLGIPVILFVRTGFLDNWTEDVAHAVVLVEAAQGERALIYDPAQDSGPVSVSWDGLIAAWAEFDYRCATITL